MNRILHYLMREPSKVQVDTTPTDQQLLQQYLDSNDEASFNNLVRRHEHAVLKACQHVLRSAVDVEDAFQATFLVLIRRARQVRWQSSLRSWLVAVAHRIAVRLAVSQQSMRQHEKNIVPAQSTTTPLADVSWQEACSVLHEELNKLPDSFRLPLLLCYLQGFSRDEAVELLGWKLGSVKAGLERGRNLLRQRLEKRGVTFSAGLLTLLTRPITSKAVTASLTARTIEAITGTVSAKVMLLSRDVGLAGWSLGSHIALCVMVLLLGTASGLSLMWAKMPTEAAATSAMFPDVIVSPYQPDAITITGTVFDPAGKPAAGAGIVVLQLKQPKPTDQAFKWPNPESGTITDSEGHFQLKVNYKQFHLIAQKPGYGLDYILVTAMNAKQPVKLQLGIEMPIEGVVLDETKKPIEGTTLGIQWIIKTRTPNTLEDALKQFQTSNNWNMFSGSDVDQLRFFFDSMLSTRSDAEGKFILRGLPEGMMPNLAYYKPGMISNSMYVVLLPGFGGQGTTRHKLTASKIWETMFRTSSQPVSSKEGNSGTLEPSKQPPSSFKRLFEGNRLTITLQQGVAIEGTVTNLHGEAVAGLGVTTSGGLFLNASTDVRGHYRITGVAPAESYLVQTRPHDRYLTAQASAVHRDTGPIRIDIQVRPGAILRGQVIDGKTGKGVQAYIQVKPTPGNPLLNKPNVLHESYTTSGVDGTFHLVAPTGDIIVTANLNAGSTTTEPMPYVPANILPSHSGLLQPSGTRENVLFQGTTQPYQLGYAYQLLELATEGEKTVELTLSRGQERTLHLVDPQGKPIKSALIAGLDQTEWPFAVKEGPHQIMGLTAAERFRHLFVIDKQQKLGAYLAMPTTETEPLTIKLDPLGSISSRLIDRDNKPHAFLRLSLRPLPQDPLRGAPYVRSEWNGQMIQVLFPPIAADKDGRFTIDDIFPNMDFYVYPTDRQGLLNTNLLSRRRLKPGEKQVWNDIKLMENSRSSPGLNR